MFITVSNYHPDLWSKEQIEAAKKYGEIVYFPFPDINGHSSREEIDNLAREYFDKIMSLKPNAVSIAGEWSFSFALISALLKHNVNVLTARSFRNAVEKKDKDDVPTKASTFRFLHYIHIRFLDDYL